MVLFSFSIGRHIPLILSGQKAQTTRQPRKLRKNGAKPYSAGEKVQLYYRSRQKKSCDNCLNYSMDDKGCVDGIGCSYQTNFFGETVITSIIHFSHTILEGMSRTDSENEFEFWLPTIDKLNCGEQISWAVFDGFQGFDEADDWFSNQYGKDWVQRDWDCILWDGSKIARRVA